MATSPNYGWETPDDTDLVKDGALSIRTLGNAIDASMNAALGTKPAGLLQSSVQTLTASSGYVFSGLTTGKYRLVLNLNSSVNGATFYFKFQETSTPKSTGYYGGDWYVQYNSSSVVGSNTNNGAAAGVCALSNTTAEQTLICIDLAVTATTGNANWSYVSRYTPRAGSGGIVNAEMTGFNAFYIYAGTGTISGTATLYRYQ